MCASLRCLVSCLVVGGISISSVSAAVAPTSLIEERLSAAHSRISEGVEYWKIDTVIKGHNDFSKAFPRGTPVLVMYSECLSACKEKECRTFDIDFDEYLCYFDTSSAGDIVHYVEGQLAPEEDSATVALEEPDAFGAYIKMQPYTQGRTTGWPPNRNSDAPSRGGSQLSTTAPSTGVGGTSSGSSAAAPAPEVAGPNTEEPAYDTRDGMCFGFGQHRVDSAPSIVFLVQGQPSNGKVVSNLESLCQKYHDLDTRSSLPEQNPASSSSSGQRQEQARNNGIWSDGDAMICPTYTTCTDTCGAVAMPTIVRAAGAQGLASTLAFKRHVKQMSIAAGSVVFGMSTLSVGAEAVAQCKERLAVYTATAPELANTVECRVVSYYCTPY